MYVVVVLLQSGIVYACEGFCKRWRFYALFLVIKPLKIRVFVPMVTIHALLFIAERGSINHQRTVVGN